LVLHPTGFSVPCCLRFTRCALTAPFHHHRACARLSIFCGTVRRKASRLSSRVYLNRYRLELRGVAPNGVRTFLPRLAPGAILHPSKTKARIMYIGENSTRVKVWHCPKLPQERGLQPASTSVCKDTLKRHECRAPQIRTPPKICSTAGKLNKKEGRTFVRP
jgi:hypothetical protein